MLSTIIVDDDIDFVESLDELLQTYNFTVLAKGHNGKEAVEIYKKFKPEIVLLDIQMPDYDGFYAIDGIRRIEPSANIVAIIGDIEQNVISRLSAMNTDYIYKPFDIQQIINIAKRIKDGTKRSGL